MCNISFIKELTEAILAMVGLISLLIPFLKKIVIPSWYFIIKILPYKIRLKWKFNEILKTQGIGTIKCVHCNSKNIRLNTKERIKEGTIPNFMKYWCYNCQKPFEMDVGDVFKMYDKKWFKHSELLKEKHKDINNKTDISK